MVRQEEDIKPATPLGTWRSTASADDAASPSQAQFAKLSSRSPTQLADSIIFENSRGIVGKRPQASSERLQEERLLASSAQRALSEPRILDTLLKQLWDDLLVYGREARQSHFRNLTTVAHSWVEPASQWLWMYVLSQSFLGAPYRADPDVTFTS